MLFAEAEGGVDSRYVALVRMPADTSPLLFQ